MSAAPPGTGHGSAAPSRTPIWRTPHAPEAADAVLNGNSARIYQVDRATPLIPNGT